MHTGFTQTNRKADRVLVVGAGAAGLMAANAAAENGAETLILEKNAKAGKKIYITGKGRCNVTNAEEDRESFLQKVIRNPRFLYAALCAFGPRDMMDLLEKSGCPVKVERGRRVFPVSDRASDVTRALEERLKKHGGRILTEHMVRRVLCGNMGVYGVECEDGTVFEAGKVIVCTGGLSYPSTGSTGDGYRMAEETGHRVSDTSPSLTGLETKETWSSSLEGLSLKNIALTGMLNGKKLFSGQGEMLFTHYGISGPLVLELSALLSGKKLEDAQAYLDMKPALTEEQLNERLLREIQQNPKKQLNTLLRGYLPIRMAEIFPMLAGMDPLLPCCTMTAVQRRKLAEFMKKIPIGITSLRPYTEAVITRGGVDVRDVNPSTMESKKVKGLYFAGEVLDVDAMTGGYNLQIAFSTGHLAGVKAAATLCQEIIEKRND